MKSFIIRILHKIFGYRKYLYVFSVCKISTLWFFRKKWDYLYFVKQLKSNANVVIIGASTGITTIPIAKKCKHGKVYAYEPVQDNFDTIVKLVDHYNLKNCVAYNIGLGNVTDKNKLMLIPIVKGVKKQGMAHLDMDSIDKYDNYTSVPTEIDRLDEREEVLNLHIDGLKLIAENYELEILKGAEETIRRCMPIIYSELWDNKKRDEVIQFIKSFGYNVCYRANGKLIDVDIDRYRNRNLFFIPN